jgi:uncharacterized protein DUF2203
MTDEPPASYTPGDLRHGRHYTLAQAMAVRGWVAERVGWVRDAQRRLVAMGPAATAAIEALGDKAGGAYPGRDTARALVEISRALGELDAVEIVLRDVDRGLIDFPAMRDGVEVYLCWLVDDEESIGFWHQPDAGFAGRRPL